MVRKTAVILLGMSLLGCKKAEPYDATLDLLRMQGDLNLAKSRIDSLEKENADDRQSDDVVLKRGDVGYALAKSDIGGITVQLKGVSDVGGAAQVTLQLGNTTTATITKTQIYAVWGPVNKDGDPDTKADSHSISPLITRPLRSGTWTTVSFPVDGAKAADIGYLRIFSINANSITLGT